MEKRSILTSKIFRLASFHALFALLAFTPAFGFSAEKDTAATDRPYEPKAPIFEHIGDSHSWSTIGKGAIPLPVILYTAKGLDVFMSDKLHEGEVYQGNNSYLLEDNKIFIAGENGKADKSQKLYDFSITRNVASMWFGMIILIIVFTSVSAAYRKRTEKAPKGLQSFMEPLILFVRDDIAIPNIGVKYKKYMNLLLTIFFFILINNLLGLVPFFPGAYNLTGNISVTLTLSLIILIVINFSGNKYYWKHILAPDIPVWLYPIMVPVEIIGIFSKPIALMIRLFANITAGHIVVLSLISLIFILKTAWVASASVPFVVFMDVLELLVAFLQAYIFAMLSALFIGMAVQEHHHEEDIV